MAELASGDHLSTSRVNRLLRPLRNKCNTLAALPKPATASCVTYSRQSSNWDLDSRSPLAPLCPLAATKKWALDRYSAADYELSNRIHGVCDAFKNIAHVACGHVCKQRIPSFAAMCTIVIGGNMPTTDSNGLVGSGEDSTDENDLLDVDSIYEAVPPHYRRFLIVSHALSMILDLCTRHHTLVTILLDHCLSFGLLHESTRLLNIILTQAFLPSHSSYPPPVTHPAHTNYLLDLHAKWATGNKPSGSSPGSLLFTTSTFCSAVLEALSRSSSCNAHTLWTSKVMSRLFHVVEGCDLDTYIVIIHALSQGFWDILDSSPDTIQDEVQQAMLKDKLSELLSNLYDLLFTQTQTHPPTPSRIHATADILHTCYAAQLHRLRASTPGSAIDLPDMIIVFTTHIYVAFRNPIDKSDRLLAILDDSSPVPTTFSKLMLYFDRLRDSQTFGDFTESFLAQLKIYSSALRSEKLFGLDASLWACALHHFEAFIANSEKGSLTLVTRCKQQLMEAVDAAERRCFGGDVDSSPIVSFPICPKRAKRTKRGRPSGHWEWEDMVESWIRVTPVHKRRKIDDDLRPQDTIIARAALGSIAASIPLSTHHRSLSMLSPTSSSQFSEPDGSDYQDETDKENHPDSPSPVVKRVYPPRRRSSNFFSLLADAQTNRIVLHPKRRSEAKPPSPIISEKYVLPSSSQESRHASRKQEQMASRRKTSPRAPSRTLFPSDDSLNLFAYATSSPARC